MDGMQCWQQRTGKTWVLTLLFASLAVCARQSNPLLNAVKGSSSADKLAFTCIQEVDHLPPLDPQADLWFKQARAMEKANGPKNFSAIGTLYRQAITKDHYKAMRNLQNLLLEGLVPPSTGKTAGEEAVEIVERMIKLNIPAGYYAMGYYLENGYGVEPDKVASLAYFRKAADLGNPEGQYAIGKILLAKRENNQANPAYQPEIGKKMLECSANQGISDASYWLGLDAKTDKDYPAAVKYYQLSVQYGGGDSAFSLEQAFSGASPSDQLYYLALTADPERVRRYKLIGTEIDGNSSARFPDIDKIVPLPPAPLPEWDGTFEYKKQQDQ